MRQDEFQQRQHMLLRDYEIYHYLDSSELHVSLHFHDFYECYCLLSGRVSYQIENESCDMLPGDLLLIGPNQLHRPLISDSSGPYERIVLWISREHIRELSTDSTDLSKCFSPAGGHLVRPEKAIRAAIVVKLEDLAECTGAEGFGADVLCRARLTDLLVELNRACGKRSRTTTGVSVDPLVGSVCGYLDEHIGERVSLDELAGSVYLSKYYLSRAFRQAAGVSIFEMLTRKRMIRARNLIMDGLPLTEVAGMCGFSEYSGFYRAFLSEYGVSPRTYLRQLTEAAKR